jgi:hypothetical protein
MRQDPSAGSTVRRTCMGSTTPLYGVTSSFTMSHVVQDRYVVCWTNPSSPAFVINHYWSFLLEIIPNYHYIEIKESVLSYYVLLLPLISWQNSYMYECLWPYYLIFIDLSKRFHISSISQFSSQSSLYHLLYTLITYIIDDIIYSRF